METKQRDYIKENMIITFFLWVILCGVSMAVMLNFASHKTIVITDATQEQAGLMESEQRHPEKELILQQKTDEEGRFRIPLPQNVRAENVIMENRYTEQELWIYIQNSDGSFYGNNAVSGDMTSVLEGRYEIQPDGVLLKFTMDGVMEYKSTMENSSLEITICRPKDTYAYVVVLDPAGGGSDLGLTGKGFQEKDIVLQVAKLVQKQLNLSDVKIYLTRTEDVQVTDADRVGLAEKTGADLYIRLGVAADWEHPESYGIQSYYNEDFFIPYFGNVDLADIMTRAVTISSSNRAVGLIPAEDGSILEKVNIPAVQLSIGYLSNEQERQLLLQEDYQEKLAEGILSAIEESCGKLDALSVRGE